MKGAIMMAKMGMMGKMMGHKGGGEKSDFDPMDMCRQMMSSMGQGSKPDSYLTPELVDLFQDWVHQINEEVIAYIGENQTASVAQVAAHLKISANSVIYLLGTLAQEGKVKLTAQLLDKEDSR
jgi:hypothetical protein